MVKQAFYCPFNLKSSDISLFKNSTFFSLNINVKHFSMSDQQKWCQVLHENGKTADIKNPHSSFLNKTAQLIYLVMVFIHIFLCIYLSRDDDNPRRVNYLSRDDDNPRRVN